MKTFISYTLLSAIFSLSLSAEEIKWSGDLRLRDDYINQKSTPVKAGDKLRSNTLRLRARLGAIAKPTDDLKVEMRIATGKGGTSTNQTLGDSSGKNGNYEFNLDRAVLSYSGLSSVLISGGRMAVPFSTVGDSNLVWDGDENLDGLSAKGSVKILNADIILNIGSFEILQSKTTSVGESNLFAYQVVGAFSLGETKFAIQSAYYDFVNTKKIIPSNGSSSTSVGTNSLSGRRNFQIFNPGLQVDLPSSLPVSFYFDYAKNTGGTPSGKDTAYLLGFKVNKLKSSGSWMLSYNYRRVEKDSVIDAFTDSDSFINGGTDGKGHLGKIAYQLNDAMESALSYYNGKAQISSAPKQHQRVFAEIVVKF